MLGMVSVSLSHVVLFGLSGISWEAVISVSECAAVVSAERGVTERVGTTRQTRFLAAPH